jgi:hypothetical protein
MDRYDLLIIIGLGFAFGLMIPRRERREFTRIESALHAQRWSYLNN